MALPTSIRPAIASDEEVLGRLGAMLVVEHYDFDSQRFLAPRPDMPQAYGRFLTQISAVRKGLERWCPLSPVCERLAYSLQSQFVWMLNAVWRQTAAARSAPKRNS
jgi:hypothetical protein